MNIKESIDQYFLLMEQIHEAFGYAEDWVVIPMDDAREYVWCLNGLYDKDGEFQTGEVRFAETFEDLNDEERGNYYSNEIYTQRFLPKYVYRTEDYTMICVDTHTDGNKFLQIFDNTKEVKI